MVILSNRVEDAKMDEKIEIIRGEITRAGGTVESVTRLGRRGFARPLSKRDAGLYLMVNFSADASKVSELTKRLTKLHQDEDIFRVQIVREMKTRPIAQAPVTAQSEA